MRVCIYCGHRQESNLSYCTECDGQTREESQPPRFPRLKGYKAMWDPRRPLHPKETARAATKERQALKRPAQAGRSKY